ncbi:TnsA-like heteromeric transposase endonuclease subunit [Streptomyces sp. NPDC033538]|uniref:TnsA-like heteromeric transposase endonuclease subunit n=1 Tax=Streptomyces sp. NPDC033538 TaxID=3155367 RepID=UPI0033E7D11E
MVVGCRRGALRELSAAEAVPGPHGQAAGTGVVWSATTGRLVHYGSAAMRLHVMFLDRDPRVSGLAARPLELRWHVPSGVRAHAPQLMVRLADGQGVLADCAAGGELSRRQRSVAAVVGEICAAVGLAVLGARACRSGLPAQCDLAGRIPAPPAPRWWVAG